MFTPQFRGVTFHLLVGWLEKMWVDFREICGIGWRWTSVVFSFLGRFFDRVDLIKPVSNVRPPARPSTESVFDFNEIWRVCRGQWVIHDGMQYDPIQGQGRGHEPFRVGNPAVFKSYLLRYLQRELTTDHGFLNKGTISKFCRTGFLIFGLVFV